MQTQQAKLRLKNAELAARLARGPIARHEQANARAAAIKWILEGLVSQGFSTRKIADWLNSHSFSSPNGKTWGKTTVCSMLSRLGIQTKAVAGRQAVAA